MSKRLNKRQAREQQELQELEAIAAAKNGQTSPSVGGTKPLASAEAVESEEEEEEEPTTTRPSQQQSVFAALNAGDDEDDAEESEDDEDASQAAAAATTTTPSKKKKKNRKKNKKKSAAPAGEEGEDAEGSSTPAGSSARKANAAPNKGLADMSLDDFDSILASQPHLAQGGRKSSKGGSSSPTTPSARGNLRASLSLQQNYLDPSIELKRQFGSAAIKAFEATQGGTAGGAAGARAKAAAARNPNLKIRSVLVQPTEQWPPIGRTFTGLTGEIFEDPAHHTKVATWEHTRAYKAAQYEFQQAVASHDPNNIYALFKSYPWHVQLLSSLSDIAKHQGDLGQASDWNARVLFVYERTAAPVWTSSLTSPSGPLPVDFSKVENRGLFLAAHRMIAFLGRRGTWRTALEWSKFVLALDMEDPHACLLWVDFLAIKSKQHRWLVEDFLPRYRKTRELDWAAGLEYAEALGTRAMDREKGDKSGESSSALLREAIKRHPSILPPLFQKIGSSLPQGMADHSALQTGIAGDELSGLRSIIAEIYAARSESLWKDADLRTWLRTNVEQVWKEVDGQKRWPTPLPSKIDDATKTSLYRHVLVSDMPDALRQSLTSLIPRKITTVASNLDSRDPLPPRGSNTTHIDDDYFAALIQRDPRLALERADEASAGIFERLRNLLPAMGFQAGGFQMEELPRGGPPRGRNDAEARTDEEEEGEQEEDEDSE